MLRAQAEGTAESKGNMAQAEGAMRVS
eukprot:COSAG03_NODE_23795_length_277_cov_0.578652_1_plen_26_part_01